MRTSDFDFALPPDLIAQHPAKARDQSRLLVLRRDSGEIAHRGFCDLLEYLRPGDVLVLNNSKVVAARLHGVNTRTGGKFEILLLEQSARNDFWAMIKPGKRARIDTTIELQNRSGNSAGITATVTEKNEEGHVRLKFSGTDEIQDELERIGEIPLPPYIERPAASEDYERYQTIYAQSRGSVAAPTAGLHFTPELMKKIQSGGVRISYVTLHVGLGTFAPVKAETLAAHTMHAERYEIPPETASAINEAKAAGRRVVAVGTTSVRTLETAARAGGRLAPESATTNIFLHPPCGFRLVDGLLTNFHLPRSTLLMLVSAFAAPGETSGRELILRAYHEAINERYRFFSYGDAMLIL